MSNVPGRDGGQGAVGGRRRGALNVAVLMGGSSEERGVSLASGCEVAAALRSRGHRVTSIDAAAGVMAPALERRILESGIGRAQVPDPPPGPPGVLPERAVIASEPVLSEVEVVFVALHGGAGEDGTIQTLLEVAGIAYAGSGPVACALAMDKDLTKRLLQGCGGGYPGLDLGRGARRGGGGAPGTTRDREADVGGLVGAPGTLARSVREVDAATEVAGDAGGRGHVRGVRGGARIHRRDRG